MVVEETGHLFEEHCECGMYNLLGRLAGSYIVCGRLKGIFNLRLAIAFFLLCTGQKAVLRVLYYGCSNEQNKHYIFDICASPMFNEDVM